MSIPAPRTGPSHLRTNTLFQPEIFSERSCRVVTVLQLRKLKLSRDLDFRFTNSLVQGRGGGRLSPTSAVSGPRPGQWSQAVSLLSTGPEALLSSSMSLVQKIRDVELMTRQGLDPWNVFYREIRDAGVLDTCVWCLSHSFFFLWIQINWQLNVKDEPSSTPRLRVIGMRRHFSDQSSVPMGQFGLTGSTSLMDYSRTLRSPNLASAAWYPTRL